MAYTPPTGNLADFELAIYTPPTGNDANFDFSTTTPDERNFELTGKQAVNDARSFELTGIKYTDNRNFEITGKEAEQDTRSFELTGDVARDTRNFELSGEERETDDRSFEILGKAFIGQPISYRIYSKDENGDLLGEFTSFKNLKFGKRLNNYGTAQFDIPVMQLSVVAGADEKLLKEDGDFLLLEDGGKIRLDNDTVLVDSSDLVLLRRHYVEIYRDVNGTQTLVWAGEQAIKEANLDNQGNNWATIICYDWLEMLNSRFTVYEKIYENDDAGDIVWDLIDTTQNDDSGDFGITEGSIGATTDRDRTFHSDNIMQAIIDMANLADGFDFEITNDKVFNVYAVKGEDKTDSVVIEYGANISRMKITDDFSHPANRALVLGNAIGETDLQRIESNDTGLQGTYKLREQKDSEMTESELSSFTDKGDAFIRKYGQALRKVDVEMIKTPTPNVTDFALGDTITLKVKTGDYDINQDYRVFEWEVEYNDDNSEKLNLVLGTFTYD
jgi:hypothetical protein